MIYSAHGYHIRLATDDDVPRLVELERLAFNDGTDVYGEEYFRTWRQVYPEGLLVAEQKGIVVAYRYSQKVDFDPALISTLTTHDAYTDNGFTCASHRPNGNSINGVTVCSISKGAGRVLFEVIFKQLRDTRGHYYFGFSRIAGFDDYCRQLEAARVDINAFGLTAVANWYATQCAKAVNGKVWPWVTARQLPLPKPNKPDPVLSKYLHNDGFGIAAILPNWMKDPKSREFGAMVLFQNPDLAR